MGFVARELEKIQAAIGAPTDANHAALWAAQQALAWALEPNAFQSPLSSITGSSEGSSDCLVGTRPQSSLQSAARIEGGA